MEMKETFEYGKKTVTQQHSQRTHSLQQYTVVYVDM